MNRLLIILFSLGLLSSFGQGNSFKLTDKTIHEGQILKTTSIQFPFAQCGLTNPVSVFLDSLVDFLNRQPQMEIKIIRKEFSTPEISIHYHRCRCEQIKQFLVSKGIAESRIMTDGVTEIFDHRKDGDSSVTIPCTEIIITKVE